MVKIAGKTPCSSIRYEAASLTSEDDINRNINDSIKALRKIIRRKINDEE